MSKGFSGYSLPVPPKNHMAINLLPNKKVIVYQHEDVFKTRFEMASERDARKCYDLIHSLMQMCCEDFDERN